MLTQSSATTKEEDKVKTINPSPTKKKNNVYSDQILYYITAKTRYFLNKITNKLFKKHKNIRLVQLGLRIIGLDLAIGQFSFS